MCRPDLAYGGHQLSIRNSKGTIEDMKFANSVVKKAKSRPSKVVYRNIGKAEDLVVYGFTDAQFKSGQKSTSGQIILIGSKENDNIVPVLWKTKLIKKACRSAKDAETISLEESIDMATFTAQQLEEIIYGKRDGERFKSTIFTDSASAIASVVSSKEVENRSIRSYVEIVKENLEEQKVDKIVWVDDRKMIADILTKEKVTKVGLEEMLRDGRLRCVKERKYYVYHDSKDFVTVGKALKEKIFKTNTTVPIRKKLAKTQTSLKKAKEEADSIKELSKSEDEVETEGETEAEIDD